MKPKLFHLILGFFIGAAYMFALDHYFLVKQRMMAEILPRHIALDVRSNTRVLHALQQDDQEQARTILKLKIESNISSLCSFSTEIPLDDQTRDSIRIGQHALVNLRNEVQMPKLSTAETKSLIESLNNSDVHWDGNFFGLYPQLKGSAKVAAQLPPEQIKPYLLEALEDTNRFVVAHVLLSSMVSAASGTNAETWNGLKVNISAEGQAIIPMDQRTDIQQKWIKGP